MLSSLTSDPLPISLLLPHKFSEGIHDPITTCEHSPLTSDPSHWAHQWLTGFQNGTGTGTHLSLFLVVMRGEYDFQLKWPFRHKVTFTLLDQVGERHVSASFRPPDSSSSFQRPMSESNIASGLPEFFPLHQLHAPEATYIHEDTLALQAVIDMGA
uniref:MATH domain-containing protein n=1 Tax=Pelusios castaneus TaxID=367368 RepID=A0A8C8VHP4_9SAUR